MIHPNRCRTLVALTLSFVALGAVGLRAQSFTDVTDQSNIMNIVAEKIAADSGWWKTGLLLIDLNGDEALDFFLSAHGDEPVAMYKDGAGVFTESPTPLPS